MVSTFNNGHGCINVITFIAAFVKKKIEILISISHFYETDVFDKSVAVVWHEC